jgi:tetratricopeptide (TPR) repeat protein
MARAALQAIAAVLSISALVADSYAQIPPRADQQHLLDSLLTLGFRALQSDPSEAIALFERAIQLDPNSVLARKQLGSSYINAGDFDAALEQFSVADYLSPSDSTKLQIAYLLNSVGRNDAAIDMFGRLRLSNDAGIRRVSERAVVFLEPTLHSKYYPWWGRMIASPYFDSRFDNTIFMGQFDVGLALDRQRTFSLLGTFRATRDTRSSTEGIPEIFSDNYILTAAGIRAEPLMGLGLEILGGVAVGLDDRTENDRIREDFRTVLTYGAGIYAETVFPEGLNFALKPWCDLYSSVGYYTRYDNIISYSNGRVGTRLAEIGYSSFDLYLRTNFAWDSERQFYNNILEGGPGFRLVPHYSWGIAVLAEMYRGFYWDRSLPMGGRERWYSSLRVHLVIDRMISFN